MKGKKSNEGLRSVFNILSCTGVCLTVILVASIDSVKGDNLLPFLVMCMIPTTLFILARLMNDPNVLLRHMFAIQVCGKVFKVNKFYRPIREGEELFIRKLRKYKGNYFKLYKFALHIWDIITYSEPTARYSKDEGQDEYGRYYLKDQYELLVRKYMKG